MDTKKLFSAALLLAGMLLIIVGVVVQDNENGQDTPPTNGHYLSTILIITGAFLMIVAVYSVYNVFIADVRLKSFGATFTGPACIQPRVLSHQAQTTKTTYAESQAIPGITAPLFNSLEDMFDLSTVPGGNPMVPSYMLDKNYRILDWNQAFSLAFDRTMEGRRGKSVLEWTYFLDNFEEVLQHGVSVFSGDKPLPRVDIEPIQYTSLRYGSIKADKRAYQLPEDDATCRGWLVTLDIKFDRRNSNYHFQRDLIRTLRWDMMWSEYALSYDRVLLNSAVYRELLDTMLGMHRGTKPIELDPIPTDARVLDLGAGTGNVSQRLAEEAGSDRMVVALENNAHMLNALTAKCKAFLRTDNQRPVVLAIKQDITSLFGLPDGYFDAAILNNVLYSVDNPTGCLKEVCRVLKPNGHVRISGPKKNTNLPALFRRIQKDLKRAGRFGELKSEFDHVKFINEYMLAPMLFQWAAHDVEGMLREAGFEGQIHSTEQAYAGQAMVLAANKSPALAT